MSWSVTEEPPFPDLRHLASFLRRPLPGLSVTVLRSAPKHRTRAVSSVRLPSLSLRAVFFETASFAVPCIEPVHSTGTLMPREARRLGR